MKKYNTWDDLQECKDNCGITRIIGYEPQAIDVWDDHLKVIAC